MNEKFIAAVDFGTRKTAFAVARVEGNNTQLLYYKTAPSAGVMHGSVAGITKVSEVLRPMVEEAEKDLGIKVRKVVTGLPKCYTKQFDATGTVKRSDPDDCITAEEIDSVKQYAQESDDEHLNNAAEQLYSIVAQSFSTETYFQLIENDIIGMTGDEITGHFKIFVGQKRPVTNMEKVLNNLGIDVASKYFTPISTAKAVLNEDDTNNGVALIDLGAGSSTLSIFSKRALSAYFSIPFGGNTVTRDIQNECGISEYYAENLKKAYGGCMPEKLLTLGEKTIQIETDDMSSYTRIPVTYLSELITARVKEIIDAMLYCIQESGFKNDLRKGIVLTGGGAEMLNIANYIREVSGYDVRIGYPKHSFVANGLDDIFKTDAATVVGLLLSGRNDGLNCCTEEGGHKEQETQGETGSNGDGGQNVGGNAGEVVGGNDGENIGGNDGGNGGAVAGGNETPGTGNTDGGNITSGGDGEKPKPGPVPGPGPGPTPVPDPKPLEEPKKKKGLIWRVKERFNGIYEEVMEKELGNDRL